jgi:hypothetical protein
MPRQVVDLFAYWRGHYVSLHSVALWKLIPSCRMWCIWRKEIIEVLKTVREQWGELKAFFFNTLYQWTAILDCFHFS